MSSVKVSVCHGSYAGGRSLKTVPAARRASGAITSAAGIAASDPATSALSHQDRKSGGNPMVATVMANEMTSDIPSAMSTENSTLCRLFISSSPWLVGRC